MNAIVLNVFIRLGDEVQIICSPEDRSWGSPYLPHEGKIGVVTSFNNVRYYKARLVPQEPGLYSERGCANVTLQDGTVLDAVSAHNIAWTDTSLHDTRREERVAANGHMDSEYDNRINELTWLEPLPETAIWEKDVVRVISGKYADFGSYRENGILHEAKLVVDYIDYHWLLSDRPNIGIQFKVSGRYEDGSTTGQVSLGADELELVARGNFWRYHNEPATLKFGSIEEEIELYAILRKIKTLRNPARDNLFLWTKAEALTAVRDGRADAMSVSSGFFGARARIEVKRFDDRDLGERVRAKSLEGFADVPEGQSDPEMDAWVEEQLRAHRSAL